MAAGEEKDDRGGVHFKYGPSFRKARVDPSSLAGINQLYRLKGPPCEAVHMGKIAVAEIISGYDGTCEGSGEATFAEGKCRIGARSGLTNKSSGCQMLECSCAGPCRIQGGTKYGL